MNFVRAKNLRTCFYEKNYGSTCDLMELTATSLCIAKEGKLYERITLEGFFMGFGKKRRWEKYIGKQLVFSDGKRRSTATLGWFQKFRIETIISWRSPYQRMMYPLQSLKVSIINDSGKLEDLGEVKILGEHSYV